MVIRKRQQMFQEQSFFLAVWGCFNSMSSCSFNLSLQDNFWTGWLLGSNLFNLACLFFKGELKSGLCLTCHFVVWTALQMDPPILKHQNSLCDWNKLNFIHTITWISGTLSEPAFLLGKGGSAGLCGSFLQKIPVRMSNLRTVY